MKKFFVLGMALAASLTANAQEDSDIVSESSRDVSTNKKGQVVTPVSGDIGLSIDAVPFLEYAGNLVKFAGAGNGTTAPGFNTEDGFTIRGRYFLDNETAFRGAVRIQSVNTVTKAIVDDASSDDAEDVVENKTSTRSTDIDLFAGIEKRRGYGRLQGYYGAEVQVGFDGGRTKNTFGNDAEDELNAANTERTLTAKNGTSITLGLQGLIGAEFFFARKMSVGGEFAWGPIYRTIAKGETTREVYSVADDDVDEVVTESFDADGVNRGFFTTATGNLFLSLYF